MAGVPTGLIGAVTLWSYIIPFAQSDPPPFANLDRVKSVVQSIAEIRENQRIQTDTLQQLNAAADRREYDAWTGSLAVAEARLKADPRDLLAQDMQRIARLRLAELSRKLGGNPPR